MPAKSKAQQRLFGMAWAVRKGKIKKKDAHGEVLKLANSKISDKDLKDFASTKGLKEHLLESLADYTTNYSGDLKPKMKDVGLNKKVFVIVKPGFLDHSAEIISMYENAGFKLYQTKTKQLTLKEAKELYKVHSKESFYEDLCAYMSSAPSMGITFHCKSTEKDFDKVAKIKDKIRKKWEYNDMRNVLHSSDSYENMLHESSIYFNII